MSHRHLVVWFRANRGCASFSKSKLRYASMSTSGGTCSPPSPPPEAETVDIQSRDRSDLCSPNFSLCDPQYQPGHTQETITYMRMLFHGYTGTSCLRFIRVPQEKLKSTQPEKASNMGP